MEREKNFKHLLENMSVPKGLSNEEAWNRLQDRITEEKNDASVVPMWRKIAAVASVAAVFAVVAWFVVGSDSQKEYLTEQDKTKVVLPDGSVVHLNKFSMINFDEGSWEEERTLTLKGEAFFEVEKGSAFTVQTDQGEVSVLGTSFNIFSRDGYFDVDCYTGKVQVDHGNENVILEPGFGTRLSNNELEAATEFEMTAPDWKDGKFSFEGLSLDRIFKEVEKEFGVDIDYNGNKELDAPTAFKIQSLESTMKILSQYYGFNYNIEGKKVTVSDN